MASYTARVHTPTLWRAGLALGRAAASRAVSLALASTCVGLVACGPSPSAPGPSAGEPSGFHVEGGFLRDPLGRALVLRGMNVSSVHKAPPYFDFHDTADYERMRDEWGQNVVRFLVEWMALEPEEGVIDEAYLDELEVRVTRATDAGLFVVLDMHQDVYGEGFGGNGAPRWTCDEAHYAAFTPTEPWFLNYLDDEVVACYDHFWQSPALRARYVDAWVRVAERLAPNERVLGLDPMNEPFWGGHDVFTFERDVLAPFYEEVVLAVREVAPHWIAFLEPSSSRNVGFATSLTPFSFGGVVYAPHSYDKDAEGGLGFDPARRPYVFEHVAALRAEADMLGAGLWIGELGGMSGPPNLDLYLDAELDAAEQSLTGFAVWHYGRDGGYGVLDELGAEKPEVFGALVRPAPVFVGGSPTALAWDAEARVFSLAWQGRAGLETEVVVPARVYGDAGFTVSCGGCEATVSAGRVRAVGEGALTLTLGPDGG